MMIKAGIIGATGYAGGEIVRILANHPDVEVVWYGSRSYIDKKYADVFSNMFQIVEGKCLDDNMEELAEQADVIFTATPQGLCASLLTEEILKKTKIIDLSADFRIKDVVTYEKWYKIRHASSQFHPFHLSFAKGRDDRSVHHHHRCKIGDIRRGKGRQGG